MDNSKEVELQKLLAFHELTLDKTEEEKRTLADQHGIDYAEYKKRMVGKEKEAEFIVIMKSLGILKHFEAYDEGLSHITKEYMPDFKVEMNDGYKMLIEVKHTDKDVYKISQGNLQKRIDFAHAQGLPLRFAVSLKGFWGLFTSETLQEAGGKLTPDDFMGPQSKSWLDTEFATCAYMFPQPIKLRSVYSKNHPKGMGIQFEPYGQLVSYELYCGGKRIFRVKGQDSSNLLHSIYLEALHDRVANIHQEIQEDGEFTVVTEYSDGEPLYIPEYEFLLSPIRHIHKNGIHYTAQSVVREHDFSYLSAEVLRYSLSQLVDCGMKIVVFKASAGYRFEDFRKNFWSKGSQV